MRIIEQLKRGHEWLMREKRRRYLLNLQSKGLTLGRKVHIVSDFFFDPSHCYLISIGDNSVICPNVRLIAHDASTKQHLGYTKLGRIDIGENCFIGDSVIVLSGVAIGPDSIVGAGSVVTRDIPAGSVAAGNPARVVCTLQEYLKKIEGLRSGGKVFSTDYFIERLDDDKRRELLDSVCKGIGFIE